MMTPEERARLEVLEELVARFLTPPPGGPVILGGDVTGAAVANTLAKIVALAGGGNQLVGVDNLGNVQVGTAPPPGPQAMGGDVTGTTAASVISQIASLAGAGIRLVAVDNFGAIGSLSPALPLAGDVTGNLLASVVAKINGSTVPAGGGLTTGNVLQVTGAAALSYGAVNLAGGANFVTGVLPEANQADQTMAGDVTGNTAASVLAKIASLAGSGTRLVAVDNGGNITSGGAVPGTPDPFAYLQTFTDLLVAPSTVVAHDVDLAAFNNSTVRVRALAYATTKDTGGVAGANMTGGAFVVSDAVFENKNGTVTFMSAAGGGAAIPMPAINNEMTLEPQGCDAALQSGGGAPPNLNWAAPGGTIARLQLTTTNNTNRGSWQIDIYRRVLAAP